MYFWRLFSKSVIAALTVLLIACVHTLPVQNIEHQAVVAAGDVSLKQVEMAIIRGGAIRRWNMRVIKPGHIEGTLNLRSHQAVVDIYYSVEDFSIQYKNSKNLEYKDGKIHLNYNRWITNLSFDIQRELALL